MKLELNVVRMTNEDAIATSAYQLKGLRDGKSGNASFNGPLPNGNNTRFAVDYMVTDWQGILDVDEDQDSSFNGYYTWNETNQRYEKIVD